MVKIRSSQFMLRVALAGLVASVASLSGCAINPATGTPDFVLVSQAQETKLGAEADLIIRGHFGVYDAESLQDYVSQVGQRLVAVSHLPHTKFTFTVLDSPDVNAFALPGGYVYVTRGILSYLNTEDELAAVLGHEIGHVTARHSARKQSRAMLTQTAAGVISESHKLLQTRLAKTALMSGSMVLVQGYGRDAELEADGLGAEYIAKAGYDPGAIIRVLSILKEQELFDEKIAKSEGREAQRYHGLFASHPKTDDRLKEAVEAARPHATNQLSSNRERYLLKIDGMAMGPAHREGVIRDNVLYHGDLKFRMMLPAGWRIENRSDALVGVSQDGSAHMRIGIEVLKDPRVDPKAPRDAYEYFGRKVSTNDLRQPIDITGPHVRGYSAVTKANGPYGPGEIRLFAVSLGRTMFFIAGAVRPGTRMTLWERDFIESVRSIRPLSASDARYTEPLRLRLVGVRKGDGLERFVAESSISSHAIDKLRLLNGLYPDGHPSAGSLFKVVR